MKAGMIWVALVGTFACNSALADGNELLRQCETAVAHSSNRSLNSEYDTGYCFGTINGVVSTMVTMNEYLLPQEKVCFPDDIKQSQGARIVVKYLEGHPASLHRSGPFLVMAAFQHSYRCK